MTDSKEPEARNDPPLDDAQLTRKDRSYSPSSDRETEEKQRESRAGGNAAGAPEGVTQLPGTGGPDDSGDTEIVDDEIDASVIVERASTQHRPGDA